MKLFLPFCVSALALPVAAVHFDDVDLFYLEFPGIRYNLWTDLSPGSRALADMAGWDESSWNLPNNATVEGLSFNSIPGDQKIALEGLGFEEDQWDCYINHYNFYDWDELVDDGVQEFFETLGWNNNSWIGNEDPPASDGKLWMDLSFEEKSAAEEVCFFKATWNSQELSNLTGIPVVYPEFRYELWSELDTTDKEFAGTAGWTEESWNAFSADHEMLAFSDVADTQKGGLTALGFYEDQYDCYINHYEGYAWSDIVQYELDPYLEVLGWTQDSWELNGTAPESEDKSWSELSDAEREAAGEICFFEVTWNELNLKEFGGDSSVAMFFRSMPVVVLVAALTSALL